MQLGSGKSDHPQIISDVTSRCDLCSFNFKVTLKSKKMQRVTCYIHFATVEPMCQKQGFMVHILSNNLKTVISVINVQKIKALCDIFCHIT